MFFKIKKLRNISVIELIENYIIFLRFNFCESPWGPVGMRMEEIFFHDEYCGRRWRINLEEGRGMEKHSPNIHCPVDIPNGFLGIASFFEKILEIF